MAGPLAQPRRVCFAGMRTVAFDELNYDVFPGETLALKEVLGLDKYRLVHSPYSSARSYLIVE